MKKTVGILLALLIPFTCAKADKLTQKDISIAIKKVAKEYKPVLAMFDNGDKDYMEFVKNHQGHLNINGVMPDAITFGILARCQNGVGMCAGEQINIAKVNGKWTTSFYSLMGLQAGLAEMYKLEIYIAACYGSCIGINAEGFFAGVDGMLGYGAGGGFFIDVGLDATDLIMNQSPTIKDITDLWNFRTAYFGWGFDIGVGIGFSAGLYYYLHNGTTEPLYVNEFMRTPFPNIHQSR